MRVNSNTPTQQKGKPVPKSGFAQRFGLTNLDTVKQHVAPVPNDNPVLIDYRTGSKDMDPELYKLGLYSKIVNLKAGDFAFIGNYEDESGNPMPINVGIERKRITHSTNDLLESIEKNRLSGFQLGNMRDIYTKIYLVVEGSYRASDIGGVEVRNDSNGFWHPAYGAFANNGGYARIQSFLLHLHHTGIGIVHTSCAADTARWIKAAYNWWSKDYVSHFDTDMPYLTMESEGRTKSGTAVSYRDMPPGKQLVWVTASGVRGMGAKAALIASSFDTVEELVFADKQTLTDILGGQALPEKLYNMLRGIQTEPKTKSKTSKR